MKIIETEEGTIIEGDIDSIDEIIVKPIKKSKSTIFSIEGTLERNIK
jgi:hypothetical protein